MPQNGQAAVLKCSPILSELKAQVHSQKEALKRKAMAVSAGKGTLLSF